MKMTDAQKLKRLSDGEALLHLPSIKIRPDSSPLTIATRVRQIQIERGYRSFDDIEQTLDAGTAMNLLMRDFKFTEFYDVREAVEIGMRFRRTTKSQPDNVVYHNTQELRDLQHELEQAHAAINKLPEWLQNAVLDQSTEPDGIELLIVTADYDLT